MTLMKLVGKVASVSPSGLQFRLIPNLIETLLFCVSKRCTYCKCVLNYILLSDEGVIIAICLKLLF